MLSVVVISKDEPALDETLSAVAGQGHDMDEATEIVVVDASQGRLASIRERHPGVQWLDFTPPAGVRISIPHQRNTGVAAARGEIIVFIDAGCRPRPGWLARLVAPLRSNEEVTAGLAVAPADTHSHYHLEVERVRDTEYLDEAPTLNLAFTRRAFELVGGFDEAFEYGSDVDFTWRLVDHGLRIRSVPEAVVEHDWGSARRQIRRAYLYGRARARLYQKHAGRRRRIWGADPVVVIYPLFVLGLPLTLLVPAYPLLLLVPAWRARRYGAARVVLDHLAYGTGVLSVVLDRGR